ncbi:MAG: phosphoribosylamine--glycine ligase [Deltaproteobacteria bacterium]|nr:phosphoribosylamine--glycine ligase [Deltaproteobacteria bacterium]
MMTPAPRIEVVLIVGSGAREHALARAAARSPGVRSVVVAPGNPGMRDVITAPDVGAEPHEIVALAQRVDADLVVIGPEAPLAAGVVDSLRAAGRRVFGPTRAAAAIETSKAWAKAFMSRHRIPTARHVTVGSLVEGRAALDALGVPVVVKASGLAQGKGVFLCDTREAAEDVLFRLLDVGELGPAGREVVLEERLAGPELSVLALVDGERFVVLPAARDHKRLLEGDRGPNTGGMGAFAPVPEADAALMGAIARDILRPAVDGMRAEGTPFVGCLFVGLMLTADGPRVLEFNARFGDPETQAILALLAPGADLAGALAAAADGRLDLAPTLAWTNERAVAVVLAAPGYPDKVMPGSRLAPTTDPEVFAAGVGRLESGELIVKGGRVMTVVGRGPTFEAAREAAYRRVAQQGFEGMQTRSDIARSALGRAPASSAYARAGVDIEAGNAAVRGMKAAVESTFGPFVLSKLGTFGGLFDARAFAGLVDPVLVASTDGVGTKTMLARVAGRWDTIGKDLVNHSVNDILVMGARPLFFLDYVAAARLDPAVIAEVVGGVAAACREHGVALLGGETAEMPGVYREGEVDLAGTIVGVVERARIIDGTAIRDGDVVLGLASSGVHTNGWSLLRRALDPIDRATAERLLDPPHRPYLAEIQALWDAGVDPVGLVHITGGGFVDNPPRLIRDQPELCFELGAWEWPPLFRFIQDRGGISTPEMRRVFNLGIGMLVVLRPQAAARARTLLPELVPMGRVRRRAPGEGAVVFEGGA